MQEKNKRNWENSKYKKFLRISEENHEWLKKNKGRFSIAGKLDSIINTYKKHYISEDVR